MSGPMALSTRVLTNSADRAAGACGRAPSPSSFASRLRRLSVRNGGHPKTNGAARSNPPHSPRSTDSKLEGFAGAVQMAEPKRKMRAASYLCEVVANRPRIVRQLSVGTTYSPRRGGGRWRAERHGRAFDRRDRSCTRPPRLIGASRRGASASRLLLACGAHASGCRPKRHLERQARGVGQNCSRTRSV